MTAPFDIRHLAPHGMAVFTLATGSMEQLDYSF